MIVSRKWMTFGPYLLLFGIEIDVPDWTFFWQEKESILGNAADSDWGDGRMSLCVRVLRQDYVGAATVTSAERAAS
jgi:hypothetical protein